MPATSRQHHSSIAPRLLLVAAVLVAGAAFWYLDLGRYLTLDYLKASQARFQDLYHSHPVATVAAYMAIYIVATALSLPGAAVLTLAGGGLFGLGVGTVAVSFASTIGATLATAVSRYLFRDWVQRRFGDRLAVVNEGMAKDGAFYLFSLRLVPVFPFFVINLVMGLTNIRLVTYYWVSQLGMLPATVVYVNAGRELGRLESLAGILSPGLIASFAALGLFPLVARKAVAFLTARRHRQP